MPSVPPTVSSQPPNAAGPSRRRVLAWLAAAVVVGAGITLTRRTTILRWLVSAPLGEERPGPLGEPARAALDATVLALLDARVERSHYAEFFRWRAEHIPGMRALFDQFTAELDRGARRLGEPSFVAAPRAKQRRLLERYRRSGGSDRLVRIVFARQEQRFARYIVRECFRIFSRTDAWVLSGYTGWPGMPRPFGGAERGPGVS